MHGYLPEMKLYFMNCIPTATLLAPNQTLPLLSAQPQGKEGIKNAVSQPQPSIARPNHQQLCHKVKPGAQ